jgi:hypothetical protein
MSRLQTMTLGIVLAIAVSSGAARAQVPTADPAGTWTFSTDSANNLVVQDLDAFSTMPGRIGPEPLCIRFFPFCPSSAERRDGGLRLGRNRYSVRGNGGKDWRLDLGQASVRQDGMTLPLQVGNTDNASMVQIVSSTGPWTVNLQRVPASELKASDGNRWKISLAFSGSVPESAAGCWIELSCPQRTGG